MTWKSKQSPNLCREMSVGVRHQDELLKITMEWLQ